MKSEQTMTIERYLKYAMTIALIATTIFAIPTEASNKLSGTAVARVYVKSVNIGEPLKLTISLSNSSNDYTPPPANEIVIPGWEVLEAYLLEESPQGAKRRYRYDFWIVSWSDGKIIIPEIEFGMVSTSPLSVRVYRPQRCSFVATEPNFFRAYLERYSDTQAIVWGVCGASIGGLLAFVLQKRRDSRYYLKREVLSILAKASSLENTLGWSEAERALRTYLGRFTDNDSHTLIELKNYVPPKWWSLIEELASDKYLPQTARSASLQVWIERATDLIREDVN